MLRVNLSTTKRRVKDCSRGISAGLTFSPPKFRKGYQ